MGLKRSIGLEENLVSETDLLPLLPFDYENLRISSDCRPIGFRFYKNSFTIGAHLHGKNILVCGEDNDRDVAVSKAVSELIERSVLIEHAAKTPSIKTSNGWAAHFDKDTAKLNAALEIVERDGVLTHWYSNAAFIEIDTRQLPINILSWVEAELSKSEFPLLRVLLSTKGIGPSVTCIFMNKNGFGVCGHSSKIDLLAAIENAIGEACRAAHLTLRNAYYADSEILKRGGSEKINPGAHAVYYAYHEPFPQWMFDEKVSWFSGQEIWNKRMTEFQKNIICDFEIETAITEPLFVTFARHPRAFDLSWGSKAPTEILNSVASYRLNRNEINLKPHPIS